MLTILSLVTSVKDYIEVLHKLIETDSTNGLNSYYDFGAGTTFLVLATKEIISNFFSLKWLQTIWSIPTLVPDIASAMISEISIFNGSFQNSMTLLEQPISYGNQNIFFYCLEKFMIGAMNSVFLFLPTSTAHIITLRRFVMQGLEAGYIAGLGTIAGNLIWIGSVIFGFRFFIIPWLSFDILRYLLGFILLVKYMWDSYSERRSILDDLSKSKIFLLNFLFAFTEQTNLFPFLSNVSIGSDSTLLETFPSLNSNLFEFFMIHGFYLIGILVGSLSLLQLTCWFWENPAYNFYIWIISSFKVTTTFYYKFLNFLFLYLTMICAISNVTYLGLDYTITNPLGFTHEDRLVEQKVLLETSFLNSKASDRNTRRNRGRHGRRERWKRRVRRYRTFDASLYDQGTYDLFTIEDLNYGFDRFWLRRKIRNHRVRFRFFPGPWMRSFKKQLTRPRLESFMGPRIEFFRILFEQAYHPEFHEFKNKSTKNLKNSISSEKISNNQNEKIMIPLENFKQNQRNFSIYFDQKLKEKKQNFITQNSALRKFLRKTENRVKLAKIQQQLQKMPLYYTNNKNPSFMKSETANLEPIYSKKWKYLFSKISHNPKKANLKLEQTLLEKFYQNSFLNLTKTNNPILGNYQKLNMNLNKNENFKQDSKKRLSNNERLILRYKTFLKSENPYNKTASYDNNNNNRINTKESEIKTLSLLNENESNSLIQPFMMQRSGNKLNNSTSYELYKPITLLHPLKYYLQQEKAFKKKLNFYGVNQYRNFEIEKNAPYFRVMMKRFFYYYKPTLRWERTMRVATMRKARRKGSRIPRKLNINSETKALATISDNYYKTENLNLKNTEKEKARTFLPRASAPLLRSTKGSERSEDMETNSNNDLIKLNKIQKPTHFYSLVSKRASRYRYEIYKDVLQHWYYSPFNRLLLKFDVDSFIRRQPKNHFLTKKDESLLHFKRFLMSEYYNSLRWYTYMQHYDSMKSKISSTKTLTSRVYNQQFIGTFKKIRHLFAITPFSNDQTILKFDQPLYNEFPNDKNQSLLSDSVFHEEILADEDFKWIFSSNSNDSLDSSVSFRLTPQEKKDILNEKETQQNNTYVKPIITDLKNQSADVIREYLKKSTPIRQEYIKFLLHNRDYSELTKFLFRGKKLRGVNPTTNESDFLLQENNALLKKPVLSNHLEINNFHNFLWFELLKKCHNKLYDQKALKNYVLSRVDKHEKQKQRKQKNLKLRIERIKNWYVSDSSNLSKSKNDLSYNGLPSAYIKAIKEAYNISVKNRKSKQKKSQKFTKSQKILLKNSLNLRLENSFNKIYSLEQNFKKTYNSNYPSGAIQQKDNISNLEKTINFVIQRTLMPFEYFKIKILNKENFKLITPWIGSLYKRSKKDLNQWKKNETVLSKRKKIRKTLKRLRNNKNLSYIHNTYESNNLKDLKKFLSLSPELAEQNKRSESKTNLRKKKDLEELKKETIKKSYITRREKTWQNYTKDSLNFLHSVKEHLFTKKFKKRRSRMRRYRFLKGRGPIKKRTLGEKLKGQFRFLKKYAAGSSRDTNDQEKIQNKKLLIFNNLLNQKSSSKMFETREIKQRRTRIRKHRFWKKHKKQKDALIRRKIKKRRRYGKAKIRVLNKKLKNIKAYNDVKKWWWQEFLPSFQEKTGNIWQTLSYNNIKNELKELSIPEILDRDKQNPSFLQIGDKDYKPLAIPEAIRIRDAYLNQMSSSLTKSVESLNSLQEKQKGVSFSSLASPHSHSKSNPELAQSRELGDSKNIVDQISNNILNSSKTEDFLFNNKQDLYINNNDKNSPFMLATNSMPFYAGWDESSRKFVITNRLLSRKDAGYSFVNNDNSFSEYLKAPFNGMNAPTTLYWQIPFTTYDPDQFFALGMDGFSPIGWRNFHFKSSKQTTKPILVKKIESTLSSNSRKFSDDLHIKLINKTLKSSFLDLKDTKNINENRFAPRENQINLYNRIQKRYKRVKKHPRPPVWFPSGTLANQVLPVHYIYVFYKRYRLPRDRYVRRKLRRNKNEDLKPFIKNLNQWTDYTLRKRAKPKRKYHRKNLKINRFGSRSERAEVKKNEDFLAHLKRRKFRGFADEKIRFRPISESQKLKELKIRKKLLTKDKKKTEKNKKQKVSKDNIRLRQLRRRVQRQVFRPVWRYKPQSGGFVWPGDYLRLELVKAPKLQINSAHSSSLLRFGGAEAKESENLKVSEKQRNIRKKKRRIIQEWQVQPKKYFLQKHNLNVLKKRLQKSQNVTF
uniref:Putative chloroplast protein RF1 n=1 Tax=Lacunastrum gracillimum TaxID=427913 RepID=A0A2U8GH14_9CHLO|nr:putative chloroplast protein RF1 [Lacunastrum gracillimum]AWI68014.1 putative chloroplast protein RF1 [Lacunastrum gracillimum]